MDDDYARQHDARERRYRESWETPEAKAWIESLLPEERVRLQQEGLLAPDIPRNGSANGCGREEDVADSCRASITPDIVGEIEGGAATQASAEQRSDVLASFCARIRCSSNPLLVFDAVCYATGVLSLEGQSETDLAKHHGVSRAAFSKIATQWVKTFNLAPSRGMKSAKARRVYSELTRAKWHERNRRKSGGSN